MKKLAKTDCVSQSVVTCYAVAQLSPGCYSGVYVSVFWINASRSSLQHARSRCTRRNRLVNQWCLQLFDTCKDIRLLRICVTKIHDDEVSSLRLSGHSMWREIGTVEENCAISHTCTLRVHVEVASIPFWHSCLHESEWAQELRGNRVSGVKTRHLWEFFELKKLGCEWPTTFYWTHTDQLICR